MGVTAKLIDEADDIDPAWLQNVQTIGVTAGASAPEVLVQSVISRLQELGGATVEELDGCEENMVFEVPRELRIKEVN